LRGVGPDQIPHAAQARPLNENDFKLPRHSNERKSVFDALKNLGNIPELIRQGRQLQEKMQSLQEELARKQVSADAGAGMVTATVNGKLELVKLKIDKSKIDVNDTEMLEDIITAAVNAAQTKAAEIAREEMQKAASAAGLPPGLLP
jgi:hypothetical protein